MAEKYFNEMKNQEFVLPLQNDPKERIMNILKEIPGALRLLKESQNYYKPIKTSIYVERKQKIPSEDDIYTCECVPSKNATAQQLTNPDISFDCKEKCVNRMISTECEVNSCPCGESCHNRQFQLQQDRAIYPFQAGAKGWGLIAAEYIPKGSFIIQYIGEIYSIKSKYGQQKLVQYSKNTCTYLMKLSSKEVIDPTEKGNLARFINHSCDPNCWTEKQNVLGEIAVGIVALKNIEPGTELTFDYQFDVFKTPLMRCLCGVKQCKGYLGLVPIEMTQEEWETKLENMPCEICATNYENDDDTLILCDMCNLGFHIDCLTPKLDQVPQGDWYCHSCVEKQKKGQTEEVEQKQITTLRSKKKVHFEELSKEICENFEKWLQENSIYSQLKDPEFLNQLKAQDNSLKNRYILSQMELHVFKKMISKIIPNDARISIFWHNSDTSYWTFFNRKIELTLIGTQFQINFVHKILEYIQSLCQTYKENLGNIIKQFKIPAIFLKKVLGEYYCNLKNVEKKYQVKVQFNRTHITDDCYPIHFLTTLFMNGKNQNIIKAHSFIKDILSPLVAWRIYMNRSDIKVIIDNLGSIKKRINPTEIRCCRDNALRDINHPFYTIYYKNKEVTYVGTDKQVRKAEQTVQDFIQRYKDFYDHSISLNYLIPVCTKDILLSIKSRAEWAFPGSKMIVYDPLYPRKKVSITLTSSYSEFDEYLSYVRKKLDNERLFPKNFILFQNQTLYEISKYFFKYLQNYIQTKSIVFMKHWDSISCEFDENSMNYKSSMKILFDEISQDYEFLFYILRVNNLYTKEKMKNFNIDVRKFLEILKFTLKQKNHFGNKNFSVLKDPVSDKLPEDYDNLVEKEKYLNPQMNYSNQLNYYHKSSPRYPPYRPRYDYGREYFPERPPLRYYNEYQPKKSEFYNKDRFKKERHNDKKSESISYKKHSRKSSKKSLSSSLSSKNSKKKEQNESSNINTNIRQQQTREDRGVEQFRFDKFKRGRREFQSSRYYKTSIDSNSENEDVYSKERKNRKQRLGSSISLESDKFEKNDQDFYERRGGFSNFQQNWEFRPQRGFYSQRNPNYPIYRRPPNDYFDYSHQRRFNPRR